ncbi:MAG: HAMP domain-containing protein [Zoogloeaceae bacterium]|nr:HAMP domain-containing protein [Zoogloeaceae bacterium]
MSRYPFAPSRLRDRVSLLVTAVAAATLLVSALVWTHATRESIHEEVEAATRVAESWLRVLSRETHTEAEQRRLVERLEAVGRLRANRVEVFDGERRLLYRSPDSPYKAGRNAPDWFVAWIQPEFQGREILSMPLTLRITPEPSRAVLDAWDTLVQGAGWGLALLTLLGLAIRLAIGRALAPLAKLEQALEHTAGGNFDTRLDRHGVAELDRLAERYNHMAATLDRALVRNACLEEDQAFVRAVNARLEDERQTLARELHDEFGQGITAVRAIAGAIAQRSADQAGLHGSAQAILAMTGQMQDGVRAILERLRRDAPDTPAPLGQTLADYCAQWARCYPDLHLTQEIGDGTASPAITATLLRLLQESLTNVARHAQARSVRVMLEAGAEELILTVTDDGRGFDPTHPTRRFGVAGMRERVDAVGGTLAIGPAQPRGTEVCARLPREARRPAGLLARHSAQPTIPGDPA